MANVNVTAASGTVRNAYNQDCDLVFVGPVTFAASGDTVTITDAKEVLWVGNPAIRLSASSTEGATYASPGTGRTFFSNGTGAIVTADSGRVVVAGTVGTGTMFFPAVILRDPS